jgi:anti-sigma regulatory factor (Ser/Thr protein kinase)
MSSAIAETVRRLPATHDAPRLARRHVASMTPAAPAELLNDALVIASELVTNAVQHARTGFVMLHASVGTGCIRIAVHDVGERLPVAPASELDLTSPTGRGLLIVAALATRWGVTPDQPPPGKTVWAELDI